MNTSPLSEHLVSAKVDYNEQSYNVSATDLTKDMLVEHALKVLGTLKNTLSKEKVISLKIVKPADQQGQESRTIILTIVHLGATTSLVSNKRLLDEQKKNTSLLPKKGPPASCSSDRPSPLTKKSLKKGQKE